MPQSENTQEVDKHRKLHNLAKIKEVLNFYDLAMFFEEKGVKANYGAVGMCCPYHEDDTPSFSYNLERQSFYCFGCKVSGDAFDYVMKKKGYTKFKEAIEFLLGFTKLDPEFMEGTGKPFVPQYKKDLQAINALRPPDKPDFDFFDDQDFREMTSRRGTFFSDRGLSKETLDFFEVGFNESEKRIILPIRDEEGQLIGATGRTVYPNFKELKIPKWKHYKNSNISRAFFNINNAIKFSKEKKGSVILCEGPADVMKLHECGYHNVMGCLSNSISKPQKVTLLRNFLSIYLFMDGDMGGETGKSAILKEINGYFNIYNIKAVEGKDPDEMTKEEIDHAIRTARKI